MMNIVLSFALAQHFQHHFPFFIVPLYIQLQNSMEVVAPLKKAAFDVHNMRNTFITLDQAFDYVGDNSRYQKRISFILSCQWIFQAFFVMGMPIYFQTPSFYCLNEEGVYRHCSEKEICDLDEDQYRVEGFNSLTKEFRLFCSEKVIVAYMASLFFVGQMFAALIFPMLASRFGRKWILLISNSIAAISIIISGCISQFQLFLFLFFMAGFGLSGFETVVYVYITEISAHRFRSMCVNILTIVWGASMIIFPTILNLFSSWRTLMIVSIGCPMLFSIACIYIFFVESPRWLAQKKRFDECRTVLRMVSIYNRRKPFDFNFVEEMDDYNNQMVKIGKFEYQDSGRSTQQRKQTYCDLFSHKKLIKLTLILMISWFLRYFSYFGMQFSLQSFGTTITSTLVYISFAEVVAAFLSMYIKLKFKRISSLQTCLILITICCLFFYLFETPIECYLSTEYCIQEFFNLLMAIILKFAIVFYMTTLNTYTGEVYPTSLRGYGYGICITFGQIGSSLVPIYVSYITTSNLASNPLTNLPFISMFCLFLTIFLPETLHQKIYDQVENDFLIDKQVKEQELAEIHS